MIAIDTNILIYAHRADSQFHTKADGILTTLAESQTLWAIPWPCLHEFLAIVTHSRIYNPPTPLDDAIEQIECWLSSPTLQILHEEGEYWPTLKETLNKGKISGPQIHDARIVALCVQNGVKTLWTADRDFSRIQSLTIQNPLL